MVLPQDIEIQEIEKCLHPQYHLQIISIMKWSIMTQETIF